MATAKKKKPPRGGKKTSPLTVAAKAKAAKALELRMEGKTFDAIAEELGYAGKQGAYDAVKRSLDAITREPAESLLRLDLERLDAMWGIHYLNAQAGDVQALAACMKIMERRAKMLGLDAPEKREIEATVQSGLDHFYGAPVGA
jgi:hypothetical protein